MVVRKFRSVFRTISTVTTIAFLASAAHAHDFWLQPQDFSLEEPGETKIDARIGHADETANWPIERRLVAELSVIGPNGVRSLMLSDLFDGSDKNISASFEELGTHIVSLISMPSYSDLSAEKFNEYIQDEGMQPIILDRNARRTTDKAGKERYARRTKALVQVGETDMLSGHITQPLGHSLEIVPRKNPYALRTGEALPVEVLYFGDPVIGGTIHVARINPSHEDVTTLTTDENGQTILSAIEPGAYMMHVGWSSRMPANIDENADYDTLFASLTFEISTK